MRTWEINKVRNVDIFGQTLQGLISRFCCLSLVTPSVYCEIQSSRAGGTSLEVE